MKRFQVTAIWAQPGENIEEVVKEVYSRLAHGELEEDMVDGAIVDLRVDAAEIPRSAGGALEEEHRRAFMRPKESGNVQPQAPPEVTSNYDRSADESELLMLETPDHMSGAPETGGLLPPAGVVHPWDQDSWIFPVDHPLSTLERVAYRQAANVRLTEPEVAKKIRQSMLAIGEISEGNHED